MLRRAARTVGQLILPAHCAACGTPVPPDGRWPLCEACARDLAALIQASYCPVCGRRAGPHTAGPDGCAFCRRYPVPFDAAVRAGTYEGPLKTLILRCKYEGRAGLAQVLGRLLAERLALADWADRVTRVVPVPLHWSRRVRRGFNQARVMAEELVRAVPGRRRVDRRTLRRTRATPHQTGIPARSRRRNVRGAFRAQRGADLGGRSILLVDDVMTSGTTVAECTRVLKRAGAAEVYLAVAATADFDDPGPW